MVRASDSYFKCAPTGKPIGEQGVNSRKPKGEPTAILSQSFSTLNEGAETTGEV